jgi:NAD(P)-dependent dehydrogenase (short-subunit alcohol dehydrogenase family)
MSSPLFQGKVAVVTGAASGIGLAVSQRFAEEGAVVMLVDADERSGRIATDQISRTGAECRFFRADVSDEHDVTLALQSILESHKRIDHLVNNAGIVLVKGIAECTGAEWDRVMGVNVKSIFLMVKYALPGLRISDQPTVVNIGSVSSIVAQQGTPAYVASKGAVLMLSKALALDLAPYGIRVNCVCPGITDTPMLRLHAAATGDAEQTLRARSGRVPLARMLSPREIADSVLYLSSTQSSGVTGTHLVVDAGYTAAAEWSA